MSRRLLRSVAGVLIGILLFAQIAVAAYACPGMSSPVGMQMSSMELADGNSGDAAVPVASIQIANYEDMAMGAMDTQNVNLCAEHCHYGQQSDQASTLTVPATFLMALYITPLVPVPVTALYPAAATTSALVTASPPRTILHCCFRI